MPGFLKSLLSAMSVCLCVRPQGYKLHLHDIASVQPAEQVCFIMKLSMHRRGLCNEAYRDRNQSNKAMLAL